MRNMLTNWLKTFVVLCGVAGFGHAEDVAFRAGGADFLVPLKIVSATQLYSFKEGKGFPALETTLIEKRRFKFSAGAAAELGTSVNVPFVAFSTRLSRSFFDTANNQLYFGVWVGKPSDKKGAIWGLAASTELW